MPDIRTLDLPSGRRIAIRYREGSGPATLVFLPGYASDMDGGKAVALDAWAAERGLAMLRFDYSGTGASPGEFEEGTLGRWLEEARFAIEQLTNGPLVLIGSSMGGWLMLQLALAMPDRIRGLLGIAAAPDFTDWGFGEEERATMRRDGRLVRDPAAGNAGLTTLAFWRSGQEVLLLGGPIALSCQVRLVHGDADDTVPLEVAVRLKDALRSADVQLTIVKGGGHRLSEPREIRTMLRSVADLLELAG
ncbi:MAG: 2-hydroxymuconic semialdehyde hydrolase [uncultured Sphingomonas sp.]|uniref:Palmitoyl-protein thioesterase ABHD10, mitochondrial n=1 Tax=uncultured Sphingomonas sp. TaxID=158754 RepID=A0A6J4TUA7_9SPHN|nr:alpha/beta hydrolase [uncultured Sphingomonas sp.]CAA9532193.1 MAG: 2-hydroxymuconic semialdehyde hydrolase [uncultured Sphingomonas sp.]